MKIKKLEINNFRGFRQATVDFPESNLAVFIGVNGQGKSSVLDLVAIFLGYFTERWSSDRGRSSEPRLTIGFSDVNNNAKTTKNSITINVEKYPEEWRFENSKVLKLVCGGGVDEGFYLLRDDHVTSYFAERMDDKIFKEANACLPLLFYLRANRFFEDTYERDRREFQENPKQHTALDNAISQKITQFTDFLDWFRIEEDKENELIKKERNFDLTNPSLQPVRKADTTFFSKLNGFSFTNLRVERDLPKSRNFAVAGFSSSLIISKNDQDFRLEQLSDGEKMLLMVVCDIARRLSVANPGLSDPLEGRGIVLIDEIELHLHPKWQREVIPALLATFPNIQFLLSTHSPQVLSSVDSEDIFLLKDGKVGKLSSNPRGMDTNTILEEVMDETPKYPREVDALIDELFSLIQQRKFDQVQAARLKVAEASPDNPVLQRADAMMERLKILN